MDTSHTITVKIPFASSHHAEIARRVLQVDAELQPQFVKRNLTTQGHLLVASFSTLTIRLARLTLNSFLENLDLVTRTLGEFADEAEQAHIGTDISSQEYMQQGRGA